MSSLTSVKYDPTRLFSHQVHWNEEHDVTSYDLFMAGKIAYRATCRPIVLGKVKVIINSLRTVTDDEDKETFYTYSYQIYRGKKVEQGKGSWEKICGLAQDALNNPPQSFCCLIC